MARTPPGEVSGHHPDHLPSRRDGATGQLVVVALTATAKTYAGKHGLDALLGALNLGTSCHAGDIVSVAAGSALHDFLVLRRRWISGQSETRLEITLDHPVRAR